ncbi:MAG: entericidin [Candidatus Omnitrophica bacterium]|nr:entericidin [Candidatus Omnitrophota bacterium]
MAKRKLLSVICLLGAVLLFVSGCGETIRGVGQDASRVIRGTKTIFISGN